MICAAILLACLLVILTSYLFLRRRYVILSLCRRIITADGSPVEKIAPTAKGKTIFGNTFDMISMDSMELFYSSRDYAKELKLSYIQYILGNPVYNIIEATDAELVLNEPKLITKAIVYRFLYPFLKTGLLTSTGKKWHARRKLLTPAFHFNILGQFEEIFKQESFKFVKNVNEKCAENKDEVISLSELIPRFTLNSICETALGVHLDDCLDGDEYRENLTKVEESFVKRVINPLLTSDFTYNTFGDGKKDVEYLRKLHAFSSGIIEKRRALFEAEMKDQTKVVEENPDFTGTKQRYAMLDTMLRAERDGLIDHAGICEEVDTFMFEGFDTTSMNLIFALMNLSLFPELQQRCYEEVNTFIGDDLDKLEVAHLSNLKYMECFIKETQRLYPSVPIVLRECIQDTVLANKLVLPKGTQIAVHIFDIHRNPKYYDKPDEFCPDRFYVENAESRHPFAFIPFSAGQRNCIGQKFAMLEMKTLLVYMLKNFQLFPMTDPTTFKFLAGILIRSHSDIKVKIVKRNTVN